MSNDYVYMYVFKSVRVCVCGGGGMCLLCVYIHVEEQILNTVSSVSHTHFKGRGKSDKHFCFSPYLCLIFPTVLLHNKKSKIIVNKIKIWYTLCKLVTGF